MTDKEAVKRSNVREFERDMRMSWTTFSRYGTWREVEAHNEAVLKKHGWTMEEFLGYIESGDDGEGVDCE